MANLLAKSKKYLLCFLAAVALVFCVTGSAMLISGKAVSAAETGHWMSHNSSGNTIQDGLTQYTASVILANDQNILEMEDNTVFFQMYVDTGSAWSAFSFLNGLESDSNSWSDVIWPGVNAGIDTQPHLIFQNGSGQVYGNGASVYGVRNVPSFSDRLISVELHIGTGQGDDVSYMKLNGNMLLHESNDVSAINYLTEANFPNGCYLGIHINLEGTSSQIIYLGEYNTPYVTSQSDELNDLILQYDPDSISDNLTVSVANLADASSATVELNGVAVDSQHYTLTADSDTTATLTIKKSFWTNAASFGADNYLTVSSTNGSAFVVLDVTTGVAPTWVEDNYTVIDEIADTSFTFNSVYDTYTAESITIQSGIYSGASLSALTAGEDYTLSAPDAQSDGTYNYTLTITEAYLEESLGTYYGRYFNISFGTNSLTASLYYQQATEGWVARSVDLEEGTTLSVDDYYTSGTFTKMNTTALRSRLYYNQGLDVTEPIVMEFKEIPTTMTWALLNVSDSLETMDYFSDNTREYSQLQAIFFGEGRSDIQKYSGFTIGSTESTNANYTKTTMKSIVVEIYFGETAGESYFRINGQNCGSPSAVQSDFEDGVAYIGWFFNGTVGGFNFTVNSHVNAPAVMSPTDDSVYAMDLAAAEDFTVQLINVNASGDITVTDAAGNTLVKDTDYTYDAETGNLTIKASYFGRIDFAKSGVISIWDNESESGTQFSMTYSSSNMQDSSVAFVTVGSLTDAVFELDGVTEVSMVLDAESNELDASDYTFANGTLTISKDVLTDAAGVTEFMAVSGAELYPCYVYAAAFENGGVLTSGSGSVSNSEGTFSVTGDAAYTVMQKMSFDAGVAFLVDFTSIPGYYNNGNGQNAGYISFNFYDPYSGYTFTYTLYANYSDDEVSANYTALYEVYSMTDSEGNAVILETTRGVNISNSENPSALGEHQIVFSFANDALTIQVDDARATTVTGLGVFNTSASVCTVEVPAGTSDAQMALTFNYYEGTEIPEEPEDPDNPGSEDPGDEPGEEPGDETEDTAGGCSGVVAGTSVILGAALIAGAVVVLKKRARKE